jgi:hypothetical protein
MKYLQTYVIYMLNIENINIYYLYVSFLNVHIFIKVNSTFFLLHLSYSQTIAIPKVLYATLADITWKISNMTEQESRENVIS